MSSLLIFRRMIDFGSAMDMFTMKHLYGSVGPSRYLFSFEPFPTAIVCELFSYKLNYYMFISIGFANNSSSCRQFKWLRLGSRDIFITILEIDGLSNGFLFLLC